MDILVADVMTREPITANPDDDLLTCAKKMSKKKVGSLVLIKDGKVSGFLTEKDIIWALVKKSKKDLKDIKAKDISARKTTTIMPTVTVYEAVAKMKKKKFKRLPVIGKNKKLVGIISARDILSFNPEIYPEFEELAQIKEEAEKLKRFEKAKDAGPSREGTCEECGRVDVLYRINGILMCESCKNAI